MHTDGQDPFDIGGSARAGDKGRIVGSLVHELPHLFFCGEGIFDDPGFCQQADMILTDHCGQAQFLARAIENECSGLGNTDIRIGKTDIYSGKLRAACLS